MISRGCQCLFVVISATSLCCKNSRANKTAALGCRLRNSQLLFPWLVDVIYISQSMDCLMSLMRSDIVVFGVFVDNDIMYSARNRE
jgi:hypothetical protein